MTYFHLGSKKIKFTVKSDIHNYITRQAFNLHIDPTNTNLAKNIFKPQGTMIWNSINKIITNLT